MKRDGHWHEEAESFAHFYQSPGLIKGVVSRFLDSRTVAAMSLLEYSGETVLLDLGCGSGVHLERLVGRCKEVVGVDYSPQMLEIAEKKLQSLKGKWRLLNHDAERALPFPDASFDRIISLGLLDYVSSPASILADCHRVLKGAGHIIFTIPRRPSLFALLRTAPGNALKKAIFNLPPIRQVVSRDELNALLFSTGFQPQAVSSVWTTMWLVKASKI